MIARQSTFWTTLSVGVILVAAFVFTGFASSAYHRERATLGLEHYQHGQALEAHKRLGPALEEFRKALFFAPDKTEYRLSLVTALMEGGGLDEAQSHLEQLSQEDPTNGFINLLLARVAVRQHKLKQAVDDYQRAVYEYWPEADLPQRRQGRWELANLLSKTGDRSGSLAELMQLYANLPANSTDQKLKIGSLLLADGATSEAARVFHDLVKQQPQSAEVRRGMGEVYFNSGEYLSARHEFQRALRLDPKDQASEQALALTNDVVDMDPMLPYVTSAEQLRRSRNLLGRVLKNVEPCANNTKLAMKSVVSGNKTPTASGFGKSVTPTDPLLQELTTAKDLFAQKKSSADMALVMQRAAAQLWSDKGRFCSVAPNDRALDTVITGISNE